INVIVLFVIVVTAMLNVNPLLTFYSLLPLPVLSISIYFVSNIINKKSEAIQERLSGLTSVAQEVYSGIRVVKAYVQEKQLGSYFDDESEDYRIKSLSLARIEALFFPLMLLLIGFSTIVTIFIGGLEVFRGSITTGNIVEFVIYVNMLTWPVTSIGWVASIVQRAAASQKRINEFLQTTSSLASGIRDVAELKGEIEFQH
ncbi:MAG: ABC transporter, partial [Bacteroidetes bacterium]|nr:ABC transporter [Bacteroidota bacterium]